MAFHWENIYSKRKLHIYILQIIKLYYSLARDILKIYILLTHLFLVIQVISFKRKGIGFSWVKAARGGSLEIYNMFWICVQIVT